MMDYPFPEPKLTFLQNGPAQIALVVSNLDQVVENYWNYFGIGPWQFYTYDREILSDQSYRGNPSDYQIRLALCNAGSMRLELIESVRGPSIYGEHINAHGYGVHHLGLLVDDIHAAIAQAKRCGIEMIQHGQGFGLEGDGYFAYLDTEQLLGVVLELIQRPKGRRAPEKVFPNP